MAEWEDVMQVVHATANQKHAWWQVSERVVSWFVRAWLPHTRGDLERGCAPHNRHPPSKIPCLAFLLHHRSRLLSPRDTLVFFRQIVQFPKVDTWLIAKAM